MNITESVVKRLREEFTDKLLGVILFGSRARKESRDDSDYDLFIILNIFLPISPFKRHKMIMSKLIDKGRVNFIIRTKEEFERDFPSLYLDLAMDGVILYDKDDYTRLRLERIRKLIDKAGLVRKKKHYGFDWCWKKQPKVYPWRIDWEGVDAVF
jgi:predicted nucleotidyltransferase